MNRMTTSLLDGSDVQTPALIAFVLFWIGLRAVLSFFWEVPLAIDEAQYLVWSRDLQAGYYSKPPMIAWAIALGTGLCGSEALGCVRWLQPLAWGLAALGVAATAWQLWRSVSAAVVAMAVFSFLPLTSFYSQVATTDAWLHLFWAWALWAFVNAVQAGPRAYSWWILCGLFCGFGLLSKYSMAVFSISVVWILWRQRWLFTLGPWLTLLSALIVLSPNLAWNMAWNFPTFQHHLDISQVKDVTEESVVHFQKLIEFWVSQFIVMGPVSFGLFLLFSWKYQLDRKGQKGERPPPLAVSLAFAWPMLILISLQSLTGKAEANWAAPASIGLSIALGGMVMRWLVVLLPNVLFATLFLALPWGLSVFGLKGHPSWDPRLPFEGYRSLAVVIESLRQSQPSAIVAAHDRQILAYMAAYLPEAKVQYLRPGEPINAVPDHHWALQAHVQKVSAEPLPPILYVWRASAAEKYQADTLATLPADSLQLKELGTPQSHSGFTASPLNFAQAEELYNLPVGRHSPGRIRAVWLSKIQ